MHSNPTGDPLHLLGAAVNGIVEMDLGGMQDHDLLDAARELRRQQCRLEAQFVRLVGAINTRGAAAADHYRSTGTFLTQDLKLGAGEAKAAVTTARCMDRLPATGAAFTAGDISGRTAAIMAVGAETVDPGVLAELETLLVDTAREHGPAAVHRLVKHARYIQDADGADDDAHTTSAAPTALRQPRAGRSPVQVTLITGLDTLRGDPGAPPAYLDWIGPVDRTTAQLLACDNQITAMVLDERGNPLDVGRRHRLATPRQRQALAVRDRHCRAPGCDRPAVWCDAHHVDPWASGGRTDLGVLVLLCRHHHRGVHRGDWRIQTLGHGRFRFHHISTDARRGRSSRAGPVPGLRC